MPTVLPKFCRAYASAKIEDRQAQNDAWAAVGQTRNGRYLRVIYKRDPKPDSIFVITAYDLQGKPLKALKRRRRKKS